MQGGPPIETGANGLSLRIKLLLGVFLLIAALIGTTLTIVGRAQRGALMREVENKIGLIGDELSLLVRSALENGNLTAVLPVVNERSSLEDVVSITILDGALGYLHSSHGENGEWTEVVSQETFRQRWTDSVPWTMTTRFSDGRRVLTRVTSLSDVEGPAGVILIDFRYDQVLGEVDRLQRTVLLLGGAGLLVGVLLTLLLAGGITGPLERLKVAAVRIGAGDFGRTVAVETRDEIGALAATFNTMSVELKKREEEVKRSARLSAIGTTASVIAHEMKTPLTSVTTYTELLQTNYEDPEFREKFTEVVAPQVTRLTKLVDDLLDYSRETRLVCTEVDLDLLLHQAMNFFGDLLVQHRVAPFESLAADRYVDGDADKLDQVFFNLVKNAVEAQVEGGALAVLTAVEGDEAVVLVADAGPGIPAETAHSIFEPFFTTKSKGTGLGLAITQKIVTAHGGSIRLWTPLREVPEQYISRLRDTLGPRWPHPDQGTCFEVRLPVLTADRKD